MLSSVENNSLEVSFSNELIGGDYKILLDTNEFNAEFEENNDHNNYTTNTSDDTSGSSITSTRFTKFLLKEEAPLPSSTR